MTVVLHIGIIWVSGITEKAFLFSLGNKMSRIKDSFSLLKDPVDVHVFMHCKTGTCHVALVACAFNHSGFHI